MLKISQPPYIHPPTIKTGTYTGNGNATQAITGVGFVPTALFIFKMADASNWGGYVKTTEMGAYARQIYNNGRYKVDHIISLDADGFTVGDSTPFSNQVNENGAVYAYIALRGI